MPIEVVVLVAGVAIIVIDVRDLVDQIKIEHSLDLETLL